MDTGVAGSRPASSGFVNSGRRRRSGRSEAAAAVRAQVEWPDDDLGRARPKGTPERLVRADEEFFAGCREAPVALLSTTFDAAREYMTSRVMRKPEVGMAASRMPGSFRDGPTTRREVRR